MTRLQRCPSCGGGNRRVKILEKTKKEDEGIILAGCMDNSQDHTFESANRVYDLKGISPTLNTCGGGVSSSENL